MAIHKQILGLGKKNRLAILDIPPQLAPDDVLIRKSIGDECQTMLRPPVNMIGIPAMKKLAREVTRWPDELNEETLAACLRQVREYLNTPPDLAGNHLTAGRDLYMAFLQEAGPMAGLDFSGAVTRMGEAMNVIPPLAQALKQGKLEQAAAHIRQIAEAQTKTFAELSELVGAN